MLMHDEHRGLLRRRPASAVCLRPVEGPLSEMCCSVHRRRPPPELGAGPTEPDV